MEKKEQWTAWPFVAAIDGFSGSGKTTLAIDLKCKLEEREKTVSVIHLDDYVRERSKRYNTGFPEWHEYYYLQWDVENLKNELFPILRSGQIQTDFVLVEGIFLQRTAWSEWFDWALFVDCPREIRYERILSRGTYQGKLEDRRALYENRYWPGEEHYLATEKPMEKADKIIKS
ncbi:AAA family ATPase [Planococcus sp. YIM B11945]|uniref:AAA family ATPase n=1 Tax=Planococcus sp. YIM B11945 TaxID=3435410 RepID=UPI003D7F13E5